MPFVFIMGMAAALAMDCFAVAIGLACGGRGLAAKQSLRLAAAFGGFQLAMTLLGWLAGARLLGLIAVFDHWVAFGLLALVGGRMVYEFFGTGDEGGDCRPDRTRGARLLVLALATSVDALAAGLGLGVVGAAVLLPAAVIGATSFALTVAGARLGPAVGRLAGRWAELLGGLILIGIGAKILAGHLGA
ncbi:MAG TPA: manganese efflux pump MntP family protein [Candidatus Aminicenantes bacterium]|nr:manganese efflux pump MntP family protein [Candidatus Aminicenantes bacterium]